MTITAFPKIFALGTRFVEDIFKEEVEITEKIDGSQFAFGLINNQLMMRSKGAMIYYPTKDKLFSPAVSYIYDIQHKLTPDRIYWGETLCRPKHNSLEYETIPKNHLALFGAADMAGTKFLTRAELEEESERLETDIVPILFYGKVLTKDHITSYLKATSYLGKANMEGVVVKNYSRPFVLNGMPLPLMCGKLVSEEFKEVHRTVWAGASIGSKWDRFIEGYRTQARWQKAVQHLREAGVLTETPKDIGALIKEVQTDITEEEKEIIKDFLWKMHSNELLRHAVKGLPEWYKETLLDNSFSNQIGEEKNG